MAYALPPLTREERAAKAKVIISTNFNSEQRVFLDFVLSHYVSIGVAELDQAKLTPLAPEVPQLPLRCRGRPGQARRDRHRVQRLPEVPVPAAERSVTAQEQLHKNIGHISC